MSDRTRDQERPKVSPNTCPIGHRTWENLCGGVDKTRCAHLGLQVWPQRAPGLRTVLGLRVPHFRTWLFEVWAVAAPRTSDYGFWDSLEGYRTRGSCRTGLRALPDRNQRSFSTQAVFCSQHTRKYDFLRLGFYCSPLNRTMGLGLGTSRATARRGLAQGNIRV